MQAVILAGGNANRLYPLDTAIPKPLMPFFDRPIVEHTIKLLAQHEVTDIIIATSYLAKDIAPYLADGSRWGVRIRYSIESQPMGTAGAVRLVKDMITDTFLVVSGDVITDIDLAVAIEKHSRAASFATILMHETDDPSQFGIADCDSAGRVTRFLEKPTAAHIETSAVSTGIYILEPEVLSCIRHNSVQDFSLNLFPLLLRNQEPVYAFDSTGYWCDAGDLLQYRNAHFDALQGKLKIDLPAVYAGEGIWVGDGVDIDPSVHLCSPIFIGSGVSIGPNARIGEHTIIGANTRIGEGACISRSVIGGGLVISEETSIADTLLNGDYAVTHREEKPARQPVPHSRPIRIPSNEPRFAQEQIA